ncbi:MAG: AraC family transcriptional regulator [Christensenella sp.]
MNMPTFRVVVADDEKLIAHNIAALISTCDPSFSVCAVCFDGQSAFAAIEQHRPHILFTDIKMPLLDGLSLIERAHQFAPNLRCVLISGYGEFEYAKTALQISAFDYLLKPLNKTELAKTIRRAKDELLSEQALLNTERVASTEQIVASVVQFLHANYSSEINFAKIAADYNFSSSYLTKIFREHTGKPPIRYLIEFRIQIAKELLRDTNLNIKEISEKTGFVDQFYFSKCFKSYCGVTPSQYKENHENNY